MLPANHDVKCQNCGSSFTIELDDFGFYETIKVPPPTWCPQCRLVRRLNWLGVRILYKRKCDFTGEDLITFYHPSLPIKVYRQDIWWSDQWDPKDYGRDYDFGRPFFEQFKELNDAVPKCALFTDYATIVESPYCNAATAQKRCYLCFKSITGEDCAYNHFTLRMNNTFDISYSSDCELCYESLNLRKCNRIFFSQDLEDCHDIWFSKDLIGCSDCVGCVNLRGQSYHMFNEKLTKEEYQKRFAEFDFGSAKNVEEMKKKAYEFSLKYPRRAFHGVNNTNVLGDYVYNCRNAQNVYFVADSENLKYSHQFISGGVNNSYDFTYFGAKSEWIYDSVWTGYNENNVKFAVWNYRNHDTEYTFACHSSEYIFGCVGLRKAQHCILNKQYTKEEYEVLVSKIKERMMASGEYGAMFPVALSPWAYNESTAFEFFPLTKEEAISKGFTWRDPDPKEYRDATITLSDNIKETGDDILQAILKCEACGKNYQIIGKELQFLKRFNLPIPRHCPLCRDRARIKLLNPMATYNRTCAKCDRGVQTSYSPDRPEIVYCENCYQQEVI